MQDKVMSILDRHSVMTIATNRPDGWPQATTVGYVNIGMILCFLISRTSQKFKNLASDDRVSITVASEPSTLSQIEGLSMAAHVIESKDEPYRTEILARLSARHPGYFDPETLDMKASALFRALPMVVSVVDFSQGLGHAEAFTVGPGEIVGLAPERPDNWGPNPAH